ncbi:MAG: HAMP domain-containing sensor histidine kinase [Myxococcota bacterium]
MSRKRPENLSAIERRSVLRLRWVAVAIEGLVALFFAPEGPAAFALVAGHAFSNVALTLVRPLSRRTLGAVLMSDGGWLALMLAFAGGPANPFSALFFVHVVLAAVLATPRWAAATWVVCTGLYASTFQSLDVHVHGNGYASHLYGMLIAFAVTSALIAAFVSRLSQSLLRREHELREARERAAASEHIASLNTLAAGAAHELGSPLGTIAVAAGELAFGATDAQREDLQLITDEVRRCRTILDAMALGAGEGGAEAPSEVSLRELVDGVRLRLAAAERARVRGEPVGALRVPIRACSQMLHNLVQNALDASRDSEVLLEWSSPTLRVLDRGEGMSESVRRRAFDPFFTTKGPESRGRGLGLFLVATVAEQLGCRVELRARVGGGTVAEITFPDACLLKLEASMTNALSLEMATS